MYSPYIIEFSVTYENLNYNTDYPEIIVEISHTFPHLFFYIIIQLQAGDIFHNERDLIKHNSINIISGVNSKLHILLISLTYK